MCVAARAAERRGGVRRQGPQWTAAQEASAPHVTGTAAIGVTTHREAHEVAAGTNAERSKIPTPQETNPCKPQDQEACAHAVVRSGSDWS